MSAQKIRVVGITGRSGSGKSLVSAHYAKQGYPVADGDEISRLVTAPGSPCLASLVAEFGSDILDASGALLRQKLADKAFSSPEGSRRLVEITHPAIIAELEKRIDAASSAGSPLFFVDGAVIIGGPVQAMCDKIVVVVAPRRLSISRIILRDGISKAAACRRLSAQKTEQELLTAADYTIENNTSEEALRQKADEVLQKLLQGL